MIIKLDIQLYIKSDFKIVVFQDKDDDDDDDDNDVFSVDADDEEPSGKKCGKGRICPCFWSADKKEKAPEKSGNCEKEF
jgi:hypothetical protein